MLQKAIDVCGPDNSPSDVGFSGLTSNCPVFEMVPENDQATCKMENVPSALAKEETASKLDKLPGNNPVQRGPGPATKPAKGAAATDAPSTAPIPTLSYTAGSSGSIPAAGNILLKASSTDAPAPQLPAEMPAPAPPAATPTPPPPAAAPPATTPAPAPPAPVAPNVKDPKNVAYSTVSSGITTVGDVAYANVLV